MLEVHAHKLPLAAGVDLAAIAARTAGFTGADLQNLCREAALHALRAGGLATTHVTAAHFETAMAAAKPSLGAADMVDRLAAAAR